MLMSVRIVTVVSTSASTLMGRSLVNVKQTTRKHWIKQAVLVRSIWNVDEGYDLATSLISMFSK